MDHLRYAGRPAQEQTEAFEAIIRAQPHLMQVLEGVRALALNDGLLVSGALYNTVWNHLTGRPVLSGVKDIDVIYFDDTDLSWDAEDREIQRAEHMFCGLPVPVELRNQARVHLWFPQKFKQPFSPLVNSQEALLRYASKTHAVGVKLDASDRMMIAAPFGLDDIFAFRVVPNPVLDNRKAHDEKGARAKGHWPELEVLPWPEPGERSV